MCYAIPGKVKKVEDNIIVVDYFGQEKKARNEFYDIKVGDYICAQGGYIIKKVPVDEAKETLAAWNELFFELQDIDVRLSGLNQNQKSEDVKLNSILDRALEGVSLKEEELLYLVRLKSPKSRELLFKTANFLRQKYHQNSCCVHGIIEFSNYCSRACSYCGISKANESIRRYRMSPDEIVETAVKAVNEYGFQALVLQSGEDPYYSADSLCDLIKRIKEKVAVLICISFGEVGLDNLERLYKAGARAILLRFETSNPKLYEEIHPNQKLETRLAHIKKAHGLGYLIMTGALIGLPGQTEQDIINDINLTRELRAEMHSFGPFIPHPQTPLAGYSPLAEEEVLKVLALARIIDPENAKILVTTAFETLAASACKNGLLAGANSVMINVTPLKYRELYSIYPNRAHTKDKINIQIKETVELLKSLGRAPTDLGVN